jgi:uncharacterized protein
MSLRRTVRWSPWDGAADGLEHLDLASEDGRIVAASVIIGAADGVPFGLSYRLVLDRAWRLREAEFVTTAEDRLTLRASGDGSWRDGEGRPLPLLDGCVDIDIAATPFTNTLPIRRLDLGPGETRDIRLVYVSPPKLELSAARQRYTALDPGRLYRFENLDDFTADLPVDGDGLVLDYPGLFRRQPS